MIRLILSLLQAVMGGAVATGEEDDSTSGVVGGTPVPPN
jgi:hypothetical protein